VGISHARRRGPVRGFVLLKGASEQRGSQIIGSGVKRRLNGGSSKMAVSDETKELLEQAKKGKARKFVMITKGTEVISLVVFKKGSAAQKIKEAKEEGRGTPCYGIITGRGMDINFRLAIDEGFEKAPVKTLSLKKFLEDEADFKCKPLFEIVKSHDVLLDEDDPLHARFIKLQPEAMAACDRHPERAEAIGALCTKIGKLLENEDTKAAEAEIVGLENLLKSLGGEHPEPTVPVPEDAPATTAPNSQSLDVQKTQLAESLKKLKPAIDRAIEVAPGRKSELFQSMTQIAGEIKQGKVDEAKSNILSLGKLVKGLIEQQAAAPASVSSGPDPKVTYQALVDKLEPLLNEARKANPDKSNALLNLWNYATDQGTDGNYKNANTALEKLETAINTALAQAPQKDTDRFGIREGLVAEKVAELERYLSDQVAAAKAQSHANVEAIEQAIEAQVPDEDAAEIALAVELEVDDLYEQVKASLDSVLGSHDGQRVLNEIEKWRKTVAASPVVELLKTTKQAFGTDADVLKDFDRLFSVVTEKVKELSQV
jgi:flagellar biosynthesis regulator FlbT